MSRADIPYSVWQIERIRKQMNAQQAIISQQADKVAKLGDLLSAKEIETQNAKDKYLILYNIYYKYRDDIIHKLTLYMPLSFESANIDAMRKDDIRSLIEKTINDLGNLLPPTKATVDDLYKRYIDAMRNEEDGEQAGIIASHAAENAKASLQQEQSTLSADEAQLNRILDPDGSMKPADLSRLYDMMSEFAFIEQFALGALYKFAILPNDFLIIVLVVAMGVLGSTLQLTYDYYRSGGIQQPSLFFLRPMLGAITALVVFILLKAGVLVVTDSAKLGEPAPLSPFFIAFVGIVSGLLSDNALETVRSVGTSWLRGSNADPTSRWASGVKALLTKQKTLTDLAAKTGLALDQLTSWVDEEEPVPADMQKLLAAWLDRDVRTLFTDMPPAEA